MKCMGGWAASDAFGRDARSEHWWLHERRGQGGANRAHEHCGETCCSDESGVHESTCVRTLAFALEYRAGRCCMSGSVLFVFVLSYLVCTNQVHVPKPCAFLLHSSL